MIGPADILRHTGSRACHDVWAVLQERGEAVRMAELQRVTGWGESSIRAAVRTLRDAGVVRSYWTKGGYAKPPLRMVTICGGELPDLPICKRRGCGRPAADSAGRLTGAFCPRCKQTERYDRRWRGMAIRRAKQMLREDHRVDPDKLLRLVRQRFPDVYMFPRLRPDQDAETGKRQPGLFDVLQAEGLLDDLQIRLFAERRKGTEP